LPTESIADRHGSDAFERWSFSTSSPFDRGRARSDGEASPYWSVYRCKGIVYASDDPQRPYPLQIVGRRVDFSPIDSAVASAERISEIVAVGRNIDGTELDDLFAATLA
jgi:G3E family GTPase